MVSSAPSCVSFSPSMSARHAAASASSAKMLPLKILRGDVATQANGADRGVLGEELGELVDGGGHGEGGGVHAALLHLSVHLLARAQLGGASDAFLVVAHGERVGRLQELGDGRDGLLVVRAAEGGEKGAHAAESHEKTDVDEPLGVSLDRLAEELVAGKVGIGEVKLNLRLDLGLRVVVQGLEGGGGATRAGSGCVRCHCPVERRCDLACARARYTGSAQRCGGGKEAPAARSKFRRSKPRAAIRRANFATRGFLGLRLEKSKP